MSDEGNVKEALGFVTALSAGAGALALKGWLLFADWRRARKAEVSQGVADDVQLIDAAMKMVEEVREEKAALKEEMKIMRALLISHEERIQAMRITNESQQAEIAALKRANTQYELENAELRKQVKKLQDQQQQRDGGR